MCPYQYALVMQASHDEYVVFTPLMFDPTPLMSDPTSRCHNSVAILP